MTDTATAPVIDRALDPIEIAPDTFVIHDTFRAPGSPFAVHMNSMLIRGAEPVVVDTGTPLDRDRYLDCLFSLVDPADVRWVFISHEDIDHVGNLDAVLEACPNATLVANWFLCDRMSTGGFDVPPTRWRWLDDGDRLDVGDRELVAVRPPLYDSPTTRGLFDPTTGVYWASDCFASPVPEPTGFVDELEPNDWAQGFQMFHVWNSPWASMLDERKYHDACDRLEALQPTAIASCHGPTIGASQIGRAFELLRAVPTNDAPPQPGQPLLDELLAAMSVSLPS